MDLKEDTLKRPSFKSKTNNFYRDKELTRTTYYSNVYVLIKLLIKESHETSVQKTKVDNVNFSFNGQNIHYKKRVDENSKQTQDVKEMSHKVTLKEK